MKFLVKFDTRKLNKVFGDNAHEVKFICGEDRRTTACNADVVSAMEKAGFAKISNKGPGWPLMVIVDHDAMKDAGIVKEWKIK